MVASACIYYRLGVIVLISLYTHVYVYGKHVHVHRLHVRRVNAALLVDITMKHCMTNDTH